MSLPPPHPYDELVRILEAQQAIWGVVKAKPLQQARRIVAEMVGAEGYLLADDMLSGSYDTGPASAGSCTSAVLRPHGGRR